MELGADDEGLQSRLLMDSELAQGLSQFAKGFVRPVEGLKGGPKRAEIAWNRPRTAGFSLIFIGFSWIFMDFLGFLMDFGGFAGW